ncbi:BppU family phage baseplate upper protein [Neobacillus sp. 3P2-tot-E-2]|uniref:BppU family phage baseplate upper protein n=1 Tax=Neobacillus sp. 3P2-tot-E-2 TaxID=3132212 RepID=UPI0039A012C2
MFKSYALTIDIRKNESPPLVYFHIDDFATAKLVISLKEKGAILSLTQSKVRMAIKKSDKTVVFQDCEVTDGEKGIIEVVLSANSLASPGIALCELYVNEGQQTAVTPRFKYHVDSALFPSGMVESSNEYSALQALITDSENAVTSANEALNTATSAIEGANTAKESADTAATNANTAADNANTAKTATEQATQAANTATTNAITATEQATTAAQSANEAATNAETRLTELNGVNAVQFNDRLNTLSTSVAQKATKEEVQAVASGSPKGTYATLTALQTAYPTGTTGIYLVTADGKWYYWNGTAWAAGGTYQSAGIADESIAIGKTNFIAVGKNLYNINTSTDGFFVNHTNGNLSANASYSASDFIPVKPNTIYIRSRDSYMAFYDANKTFISGQANTVTGSFTTPANCYYLRTSVQPLSAKAAFQLEVGSTITSYENYKYVLNSYTDILKNIPSKGITLGLLEDLVSRYTYTKNLFNKATITDNYMMNNVTGNPLSNTGYYLSDYIPVTSNTAYAVPLPCYMAEYGSGKAFILGKTPSDYTNTFTTGANTYFVRISPQRANCPVDQFQFELGTTPTGYESYGLIPANLVNGVPVIISSTSGVNWKNKVWSQLGDSITAQGKWQPYVISALSLVSKNYGVSGTRVADSTGSDTQAMCRDERINAIDIISDVISFMGGTNDWANNVPLGDISSTDVSTFYGAVKTVAQKLITKFPSKSIVFMTTPYGKYPNRAGWSDPYGLKNNLGLTTGDYGKVIMEVARLHGIPCVDVFGNAGWSDINIATFVTDDGAFLHPNTEGGKKIARLVISKLKEIEPVA